MEQWEQELLGETHKLPEPKCVAGKWGPIAFAVGPVVDLDEFDGAAHDVLSKCDMLCAAASDKYRQWKQAPLGTVRDSLWSEYDEIMREYRILCGWYHAAKAVYFFTTNGCRSMYLPEVTEIGIVDLKD